MDWEPLLAVPFMAIFAEILMPLRIFDFREREDAEDENPWSQSGYIWPPSDYSPLFRYRPWQLVLQIVVYATIGVLALRQGYLVELLLLFALATSLTMWRVWRNMRESG